MPRNALIPMLLLPAVLSTSCTQPPAEREVEFTLSFAHVAGLQPLTLGSATPYVNEKGNHYGVARLVYFVSDVRLVGQGQQDVALVDAHYVDAADPATRRVTRAVTVPRGEYTDVMFTLGIAADRNTSGRFPLPPESLMEWPDTMGGGYHYLKMEGRYTTVGGQDASYTVHTGKLDGHDYAVRVSLPLDALTVDDDTEIELVMDVNGWFRGPHPYDLDVYGAGVMNNATAQAALQERGSGAFALGHVGATRQAAAPVVPAPVVLEYPPGVPVPMVVPADNPTTVAGAELGRRLYYDTRLDGTGTRACGNCHVQAGSFTSDRAVGVLPHINLAFGSVFLWDGKVAGGLEDIMRFEVEEFFAASPAKLAEDAVYAPMFERAFGPGPITTQKAAYALAQFERTLLSFNSRYDHFLRGGASLTDSEQRGLEIFFSETGDCFHCHGTLLFTDNLFHNNALDTEFTRKGLGDVTHDPADDGKFKTPTLRNIALTAPYMHDDRFATLGQVVNHYSEGLHASATVDPLMKRLGTGGVQLTAVQKADLIAFLQTLTDPAFTTNPALSSPF